MFSVFIIIQGDEEMIKKHLKLLTLVFILFVAGGVYVAEKAEASVVENPIVIDLDKEQNLVNGVNGIQPLSGYTVIEVNKPIKHQGFINYASLVKMEQRQRNNMGVLDVISAGLLPVAGGVAVAAAKAFDNSPTKLSQAVANKQNAYVVTVYANGVKPSLSVISYIYYTKQTLRFVYKK